MSLLTWVLLGIDGIALFILLFLAVFLRYFIYSFLAVSKPIYPANILIVEGWLEEPNLRAAIAEFETGNYQHLVTVGGHINLGWFLSDYKTVAEIASVTLLSLGFDQDKLTAIPSEKTTRDRTAATAIAFREWLSNHQTEVQGINIYSNNVHARRSYLIYKSHLPSTVKLGVIATKSQGHTPDNWWKSSSGIKTIVMELIAYCYVVYRSIRPPSGDYDY